MAKRKKSVRVFLYQEELDLAEAHALAAGMHLPKYARARLLGIDLPEATAALLRRMHRRADPVERELLRAMSLVSAQLSSVAAHLNDVREYHHYPEWWRIEQHFDEMVATARVWREYVLQQSDGV